MFIRRFGSRLLVRNYSALLTIQIYIAHLLEILEEKHSSCWMAHVVAACVNHACHYGAISIDYLI